MEKSVADLLRDFNDHQSIHTALQRLGHIVEAAGFHAFKSRNDEIEGNYQLMLDFMERGYSDPQREHIYRELLLQTYQLLQDVRLKCRIGEVPSYRDAAHRCEMAQFAGDRNDIKAKLEGYVADMAMLSLEPEHTRAEHYRHLLITHDVYMSRLFDWLLVSPSWTEADAAFYSALLTSPAIDTIDAQWMVSAIMVAGVNLFDINKLRVLADVYRADVPEPLRQRALVGWAFMLDGTQTLMLEEQRAMVARLMGHDGGGAELRALQRQILTAANTIYDDERIRREVMPTLVKQGNMDLSQLSKDITQASDMNDILHPEDAEKTAGDVEKAMAKMRDWATKGVDIYYSAFNQTKRYGFFAQLGHWFEPFFLDNPAIDYGQTDGPEVRRVVQTMLSAIPFCDSDKYSFALVFSKVLGRLPEQLRQAVMENRAGFLSLGEGQLSATDAVRNNYLHDVFRFYNLYGSRADFANPFLQRGDSGRVRVWLTDSSLFGDRLDYPDMYYDMLRYLDSLDAADRSHYRDTILPMLHGACAPRSVGDELFMANYQYQYGDRKEGLAHYQRIAMCNPNNEEALRMAAHGYMEQKSYGRALACYERLVAMDATQVSYEVNRALCLLMNRHTEEAMPILHKLYYEHPDNLSVVRGRLWGMMELKQYAQAEPEYSKLCEANPDQAEDRLNYGYCLWLSGKVQQAVTVFCDYLRLKAGSERGWGALIYTAFMADRAFLQAHGMDSTALHIMADLVAMRMEG